MLNVLLRQVQLHQYEHQEILHKQLHHFDEQRPAAVIHLHLASTAKDACNVYLLVMSSRKKFINSSNDNIPLQTYL
ncbi:hypothetical protein T08_5758 [Trichinella sp. T8]|nr:hypothetical protein T08_5758 [Trichinella sp. T8]